MHGQQKIWREPVRIVTGRILEWRYKGKKHRKCINLTSNTCTVHCLHTCLMLDVCDFLDHLGFRGFLDDTWGFLDPNWWGIHVTIRKLKMLTVEEDGPVNLLFLWAWLGSCVLLARVRALSAWSSPASASSHIWQARWLISQNRVFSRMVEFLHALPVAKFYIYLCLLN